MTQANRRSTRTTHPESTPALRVRVLGAFEVHRGDTFLEPDAWGRKSARALLSLLLLHPDGITREAAAEALWPEAGPAASDRDLRVALSSLRQAIEPASAHAGCRSVRLPDRQTVLRLVFFPEDEVDLHQFSQPAELAGLDTAGLQARADLYRGELLPEFAYEEWTVRARESLHARWQAILLLLATRYAEAGDAAAALRAIDRLLADDPTHEDAARLGMQILEQLGRRNEGLRIYRRLRQALHDDLGVDPGAATERLAARLRSAQTRSLRQERHDRLCALDAEIHQRATGSSSAEAERRLAGLWTQRALLHNELNEYQAALESIAHGRSLVQGSDCPAEEGLLCWAEALTRDLQGLQGDALELAEQAGELARRCNDAELETRAHISTAHILEQLGRPDDAIDAACAACRAADTFGSRELALHARRTLAIATWRAGRFGEAEQLHRRNLDESRVLGKAEWEGYIACGLASALTPQGKLDDAEEALDAARTAVHHTGDDHLDLYIAYHLGGLWRERAYLLAEGLRGRPPAADKVEDARRWCKAHLSRGFRLVELDGATYMELFSALDLATAYVEWGDIGDAVPLMDRARATAKDISSNRTVHGWLVLGEGGLALALGDQEAAVRKAIAAIRVLATASPGGLSEAHRLAAMAHVGCGGSNVAGYHWQASRDAASRCGQRVEQLRTRNAFLQARSSQVILTG